MSAGRVAVGLLVVALLSVALFLRLSGEPANPQRETSYPAELPDGPGRAIAARNCLVCHSAMLVTQQRKDAYGWEESVAQMEAWSAQLPPAERDTLLKYLARHFAPAPPKKPAAKK